MGQTIRLGNDDYTVVGVIDSTSFMSGGAQAYVPFTTVETRLGASNGISQIIGFAKEGTDMDRLVETTQSYVAQYSVWMRKRCTCRRSTPSSSRWRR